MPRKDTQFKPGQFGNPNGRPRGSKNKLSEDLLEVLTESFEKRGRTAIDHVVKNSPGEYWRIISGLMPKELLLEINQEEKPRWVINAKPLTTLEWMQEHDLLNLNPEPAKLENISPDQKTISTNRKPDG